jgi:hypothetical protein
LPYRRARRRSRSASPAAALVGFGLIGTVAVGVRVGGHAAVSMAHASAIAFC